MAKILRGFKIALRLFHITALFTVIFIKIKFPYHIMIQISMNDPFFFFFELIFLNLRVHYFILHNLTT